MSPLAAFAGAAVEVGVRATGGGLEIAAVDAAPDLAMVQIWRMLQRATARQGRCGRRSTWHARPPCLGRIDQAGRLLVFKHVPLDGLDKQLEPGMVRVGVSGLIQLEEQFGFRLADASAGGTAGSKIARRSVVDVGGDRSGENLPFESFEFGKVVIGYSIDWGSDRGLGPLFPPPPGRDSRSGRWTPPRRACPGGRG